VEQLQPPSVSNSRGRNRFRARSLEVAAVGLAASAAPQGAAAAIISGLVTQSPNSILTIDGISPEGDIDLNSMLNMSGNLDLKLTGLGGSTIELATSPTGGMMNIDWLSIFDVGETVDGSLTFNGTGFLVRDGGTNPYWTPGETAYAGFVFNPSGTPLYGWLEIRFEAGGTNFTVLQWAYEDSGDEIPVGTIPEPSTAIIFGLGLAALTGVSRRGRRRRIAADSA